METDAPPAYPPATWRLLHTPFTTGPMNMAIDEAILLANAGGSAPPTLRFFGWTPPCLSLGYAQPRREVDTARLQAHGYDLVRRPTGGRAILHTDELTYSVIAPMDEPRVVGGVVESYQHLSAGLKIGLERLGLAVRADKQYAPTETSGPKGPVCFEVPSNYEITVSLDGRLHKLLGSAQVRKQGVVLQHGTLPLTGDTRRIVDVLVFDSEAERQTAAERVLQRAATLEAVLGRAIPWDEAAAAMAAGFSEALNLTLVPSPLTAAEAALAEQLCAGKYATAAWNDRIP